MHVADLDSSQCGVSEEHPGDMLVCFLCQYHPDSQSNTWSLFMEILGGKSSIGNWLGGYEIVERTKNLILSWYKKIFLALLVTNTYEGDISHFACCLLEEYKFMNSFVHSITCLRMSWVSTCLSSCPCLKWNQTFTCYPSHQTLTICIAISLIIRCTFCLHSKS